MNKRGSCVEHQQAIEHTRRAGEVNDLIRQKIGLPKELDLIVVVYACVSDAERKAAVQHIANCEDSACIEYKMHPPHAWIRCADCGEYLGEFCNGDYDCRLGSVVLNSATNAKTIFARNAFRTTQSNVPNVMKVHADA
jgi:hypothetical protein